MKPESVERVKDPKTPKPRKLRRRLRRPSKDAKLTDAQVTALRKVQATYLELKYTRDGLISTLQSLAPEDLTLVLSPYTTDASTRIQLKKLSGIGSFIQGRATELADLCDDFEDQISELKQTLKGQGA